MGHAICPETDGVEDIFFTENRCGYSDEPVVGGEVNGLHRPEFLRAYLRELHRAINDSMPVRGNFVWTLLDDIEWEDGCERRFGAVHVGFATKVRTPKLSAHYHGTVMRENRVV